MADVRLFTGLQIGPAITGNMAPHFRDARVYETLGQQRVVILQESEARNAIF
ncbi:MAG: hypothetical protein HY073_01280 [Deltaproteobacteria bacterium]|nr:hypothetical protein [Deltaproteobacteria bacterium]